MVSGFVADENVLGGVLVENIEVSIRKLLRHWCAKHEEACVEDFNKKAITIVYLYLISTKTDKALDSECRYPTKRKLASC